MDPWLDDLSEDWVSQPRSSSPASLIGSTTSGLDPSSIASNASTSKIPRYRPRRKTTAAGGNGKVSVLGSIRETTHDGNDGSGVLAERSFSDLNIPLQRGPNPPLKLADGERGRPLSRAVSISSTRTALNHTLQRKTQSSSPQKDRRYQETPEWKKRLLSADIGYGEQRDLFSPMGLENIFRPPPPQPTPVVGRQEEVSYMPSSPPPYPSHIRQNAIDSFQAEEHRYMGGKKLGPLDEEEEDGMASRNDSESRKPNNAKEHNEPEQTPTRPAGEGSSFNPIATSTWRENRENQRSLVSHVLHVGDDERPPVTAYRLESKTDMLDKGILQEEEQRSVCGQDEEMNEEISPIFISRHNTVDGRIGYAAFSSPNRNVRRKPAGLTTPDSDDSRKDSPALPDPKIAKRFILSDPDRHSESTSQIFPDDLSTGTQDFVAKGGFIGVRRGGYSDEGSFQQRILSPSSMYPANASQLARDESCEFSSGDELPRIRRLRPSADESPVPPPAAPTPPVAPTTPTQAPRHKNGEAGGASKSSGSPLKLFGNYDTFTNEKLLRRMSQLEDSFLGDESNDGSGIPRTDYVGETDEASLGYPGPHTMLQEDQMQGLRNSSFGVGVLDSYEFQEQSFASSQPDDYDEDGENKPPLPELKPGVHTRFPLLPSPLAGDNAQARSRGFKITTTQTSTTTEERTTRIRTSVNHQSTETPLRRRLSHSNTRAELESGVGENNGRDAPYSPVKDRTPKRRRTLNVKDLDTPVDSEVPKAVTEGARHMQSIIGRKRKDARYEKDNKPVNPDVVAMRQILRPRTPTPSQTRARCRQATRNASNPKSPSPKRQAGQHENGNGMEANVDVAVSTTTVADEAAAVSIGQPMVNESRKGSVTTQDFLDEALKVMDMIRAKGRPGSGLTSVDESEEEGERKVADERDQILMSDDSTQEEFERPPSREYNTGPRRKVGIEHDARVASHLRKYEDTTNMDDITASLNSLNILKAAKAAQRALEAEGEIECDPPNIRITENPSQRKRKHSSSSAQSLQNRLSNPDVQGQDSQSSSASSSTRRTRSIPTGSSTRSETLQVIPPHKVSHLIPGQVAGMVYDRTNNLWVKRKNVGDKSESETSEEDPFGGIPDLSVNEVEELDRVKLAAEQSRYVLDRTGGSSPPEEQIERIYPKDGDIGYGSPTNAREAGGTTETSSTQSRNSRLASSGLQPETRATSWGESPLGDVIQSYQGKHEVHVSTDETHTRDGQNEEIEHEIQVHEDRGEAEINRSISGQHRRGLHIAFSSPLVSLRHRDIGGPPEPMADIWNDDSQLDNEDSGIDQFLELEHSSLSLQSSSRRMSFGFAPRSAYRGAARRISIGGRSFSARLFSRIDEQNEESVSLSQRNNVARRASLGVTISTPMPLRDLPGSSSMPPPTTGRRNNVSFHLSSLPNFDLDPIDDAYALEVSYIAQLRGDVSLQGVECSFSLATEELVKRLTDVEPYEPYWEYIRQIDLRQKGLITLHMLNDFCPRIEELDVSDNEIGQLSGAPPGIRNLKIANNCLSNLTSWGHLINLQYLDISGNEMDSLLGFAGLKHLRDLKADDNEIKSLDGVNELDGLISLSVRNNRLEIVDFEKSELKRLSTLDLRGNKIKEVRNLHNLAALTHLNLEDNSLQEVTLPKATQMERLCSLRLSKNKLRSIDISCFPDLKILYLDENQLGRVEGLQGAKHLDSLSMREQARGQEDYASLNADDCFEVRKLYISGNVFPSFTPKLDFLNLQYLELANAGLTTLPAQFGHMVQNARVLNLNFNALSDIRPLRGIKRLKKLLLAGNRLTRLRKTTSVLAKLHNLSGIDIRNNPLTVGFYLAATESRLVRNSIEHIHPDVDPFSLPTGDKEADGPYRARLDEDTKLKRKVYEMLIGFGCPYLKELDGMIFDKDQVLVRDKTWERLKQLGIVKLTGNEYEGKEVRDIGLDAETRKETMPLEKDETSDEDHLTDAGSGAKAKNGVVARENEAVVDAGSHEAAEEKATSPEIGGEEAMADTKSNTTSPAKETTTTKGPIPGPASSKVDTIPVKETSEATAAADMRADDDIPPSTESEFESAEGKEKVCSGETREELTAASSL
ncbi:MAG: hypothetical protein M1840_004226 [Geoglossum simile]|nr:MAG: hypothetical protein M1840_004226 [Geoglossum simile]